MVPDSKLDPEHAKLATHSVQHLHQFDPKVSLLYSFFLSVYLKYFGDNLLKSFFFSFWLIFYPLDPNRIRGSAYF